MNAASLQTARLALRTARVEDADRIAAYHAENRAHLAPWEPLRPEEYYTPAWWRRALQPPAGGAEGPVRFLIAPRAEPGGALLGRAELSNIARGPFQAAHLGFSLAERAQGQGYMREALGAIVAFAFASEGLGLHRIMANHLPENARSARLLAGLGFVEEGLAREYLLIAGAWRDHVLRSLVNRAWRPPSTLTA